MTMTWHADMVVRKKNQVMPRGAQMEGSDDCAKREPIRTCHVSRLVKLGLIQIERGGKTQRLEIKNLFYSFSKAHAGSDIFKINF